MKIEIKKTTKYQCAYAITRNDNSVEHIVLETKIYLLHDICHFAVEKNLQYTKGFWGMLSQGFTLGELFGKNNPHTEELRFIEKIVGPVQSAYLGYIPQKDFAQHIRHLDFEVSEIVLNTCLAEIKSIIADWEKLSLGQHLMLDWNL